MSARKSSRSWWWPTINKKNSQEEPQTITTTATPMAAAEKAASMWSAVGWIGAHEPLMSLGCVLAEYAMKTALSYLPESEEHRYVRLLDAFGVDLEEIGLLSIGQCAFRAATARTHAGFNAHQQQHTGGQTQGLVHAMDGVLRIAALPETLPPHQHARFSELMLLSTTTTTPAQVMRLARVAYGDEPASEWVRGAMVPLLRRCHRGQLDVATCAAAYAEWRAFCVRSAVVVRALGGPALRLLATADA